MPISLSSGGGSGKPWIRYSPQANAWMHAADGGAEEFQPVGAAMIVDIERLTLGWLTLGDGVRDWQPWPSPTQRTAKPSDEAKAGFTVNVFAPKLLGDQVFEWSSNATASTRFIEALFAQAEDNFGKGQVPVVTITGSKVLKIGKGTTREIEFKIAKWVPRPAELDGDAEPAPAPAAKPAAKKAAPALADDSLEF